MNIPRATLFATGYVTPRYLTQGAKVIIPYQHEGKWVGLNCIVEDAAGDAGRVVNKKYNVDQWVKREDMVVPVGHPLSK